MRSTQIVILAVTIFVVGLIVYYVSQGELNLPEDEVEADIAGEASRSLSQTQESLSKVGETPNLNPVEKANPFSDSYRNPFE